MTQDPWGQQRPAGYVVRGEVVQDGESGTPAGGQAPMTHFQKVASAMRADQPQQAPGQAEDVASTEEPSTEEVRAVSSPDTGRGDYWDDDEDAPEAESVDSAAGPAEDTAASESAAAVEPETAASAPDGEAEEPDEVAGPDSHDATQPSMPNVFGTARAPAATVPTVPIALGGEPDGGGRHAAPEVPDAEAAPIAEAAPVASAAEAASVAPAAEAGLRPGESGTTLGLGQSGYGSLLADTADLRAQWHRIQYKFVDDPRASVGEAADAIAQVAARLEAAIAERQRGLRGRWDTSAAADTETLRETLRMYRSFLDQLIGPEPS
jgi:hypothetical protein